MLLRVARRRASLEAGSAREFMRIEFTSDAGDFDLAPSVYEISPADAVRAHTEHYAWNGLRPAGRTNFDLQQLHRVQRATQGNTGFTFADAAHRELLFESTEDLEAVTIRLLNEIAVRSVEVTPSQMRAYVISRYRERDPEWVRFAQRAAGDWRKWLDRG
ncbi:MAG: hypothetical protein AB1716_03225 [Planctomycetota bacterium]